MTSAVLIIPADHLKAANAFGAESGWGDGCFSVALSPTGNAPATHYGCRADVSQSFVAMVAKPPPELEWLAAVLDADFSELPGGEHWPAVLADRGLQPVDAD